MATAYRQPATDRSHVRSYVFLSVAVLALLIPVSGKAFNIDDTLFLYVARQVTQHPLDPFGFNVNWYREAVPVATETRNPPLASYFLAAAAVVVGWSERALHLAFLLPAVGAVCGTYRLARRLTRSPLLAAIATLLTPAFLVSANSVMSDVTMLALWLWATVFWMEGLEPEQPLFLGLSVLLITLCALTKYFGIALIPLLAAYSLARTRRLGRWAWYFLFPVLALIDYEQWTKLHYGLRAITASAHFSNAFRKQNASPAFVKAMVDLSFLGGCMLPALTLAPLLWSRKKILGVCALSAVAAYAIGSGRLSLGNFLWPPDFHHHWLAVTLHLTLFIAGGVSILALAVWDFWKKKDPDSLFLLLWVFGTFIFTGFLNWTINARSILALLPAAGILLARRVDFLESTGRKTRARAIAFSLALAGAVSLWLTFGDAEMANSARTAAARISQKTNNQPEEVWFVGHWGFQYYMEASGAHAASISDPPRQPGNFLAIAEPRLMFELRPPFIASRDEIKIPIRLGITSTQSDLGAGFYDSDLGPLPFAIGSVPPERYDLIQLRSKSPAAEKR